MSVSIPLEYQLLAQPLGPDTSAVRRSSCLVSVSVSVSTPLEYQWRKVKNKQRASICPSAQASIGAQATVVARPLGPDTSAVSRQAVCEKDEEVGLEFTQKKSLTKSVYHQNVVADLI